MKNIKESIDKELLHASENVSKLEAYDEIYFLGDFTHSFATRANDISVKLQNFAGIIVFSISNEKRIRLSNKIKHNKNYNIILIDDFFEEVSKKNILVIDFNDDIAGKCVAESIKRKNIDVFDYIYAMHELKMAHTYLTVDEERRILIDNIDRYCNLIEKLHDNVSKKTLYARLISFIRLDRYPLLNINYPFLLFTNDRASTIGMVLRNNEIYIDAGAAHGDTVSLFFHISRGEYKEIHAFEPDTKNFNSLNNLCKYIPNSKCYNSGLGDIYEEIEFFEFPENRLGSNFIPKSLNTHSSNINTINTKILKLDDTLESATLMKIDVEGYEVKVINGSKRIIEENKPNIIISAYHYPLDILDIIENVDNIYPYKNIALRHYGSTLYDTEVMFSDFQSFDC